MSSIKIIPMRNNNKDYEQWREDDRRNDYSRRNRGQHEDYRPPYGTHTPPVGTPPDYSSQRYGGTYRQDEQWQQEDRGYRQQHFRDDHEEVNRHRRISRDLYGEHPASMGKQEYLGSEKRHPGLGYTDYIAGERNMEDYYGHRVYDNYERYPEEERRDKKHQTGEFIPGRPKPWNRGDYRHSAAGQYMEMPMFNERNDPERDYRREGHQNFRETEGFGRREGEIPGEDWYNMDEYPQGHRQGRRTYSKYNNKLY
jgi:hypothetical protein